MPDNPAMPDRRPDPFAGVTALTGVGAAAGHARDAVDALLRQPAMRRDAGRVAAESALRGARASAALAGADPDNVEDPQIQGALRALAEVPSLAASWRQRPRQVLARLHVLAARGTADDGRLGQPRVDLDHARFDQLLDLAAAPTAAPTVVVAAIVHGELLALRPFGSADDLVARAAERVVLVAGGVDTKAVSVPEAGHRARERAYLPLHEGYEEGGPDGVAAWVRHCCAAYARGAEEGITICREL
jgi:hypothetical protein